MKSQTVRRGAPFAAVAAVVAVVAGSAFLLQDSPAAPGSSGPPPLLIGTGFATADLAQGKSRVIVSGDLPDGPDSARVHRLGPADTDLVDRLAAALDVDPSSVLTGDALPPGEGELLRVAEGQGGAWQFVRADAYECGDQPVDGGPDGSVTSRCAAPPPKDRPVIGNPPGAAEAIAAVRPVLSAIGLDVDEGQLAAAAESGVEQDTRRLWINPPIADGPTSGVATVVTVDRRGILTASGWLGEARPGDDYPVVSAQEAVDQLGAMPVPLMACPESTTPVPPGPVCGGPLEVTGAAFGLSLQWEGEKAVLVPSWLLDIKGSPEPTAVVAVDPSYLQPPPQPSGEEPGSGSSGSGVPGSPGTADPGTAAPPVAPQVEPSPAMSRFDSVTPVDGGAALRVTFYGGVDSCFDYTVGAEETADQVSLRLVEARKGEVCIELAQQYERTVELSRPLGERRVVDAETGVSIYPVRSD